MMYLKNSGVEVLIGDEIKTYDYYSKRAGEMGVAIEWVTRLTRSAVIKVREQCQPLRPALGPAT